MCCKLQLLTCSVRLAWAEGAGGSDQACLPLPFNTHRDFPWARAPHRMVVVRSMEGRLYTLTASSLVHT